MPDGCSTCKYGVTTNSQLRCQRYAPHPSETTVAKWPAVLGNDWCGEFAAIVVTQESADAADSVHR
jgi:hypothetical protein